MELKTTSSLPSRVTAQILGISQRMVQLLGARWEFNARVDHDSNLFSSPTVGLRREFTTSHKAVYDPRDIDEYRANAVRERLGQPHLNWRKEASHDS